MFNLAQSICLKDNASKLKKAFYYHETSPPSSVYPSTHPFIQPPTLFIDVPITKVNLNVCSGNVYRIYITCQSKISHSINQSVDHIVIITGPKGAYFYKAILLQSFFLSITSQSINQLFNKSIIQSVIPL